MGGIAACLFVTGVVSQVISVYELTIPTHGLAYSALAGVSGLIAFLVFIGFILFLVAMYGFSKDYGEPKIFNFLLYGLIIAIVVGIIAVVVAVFVAIVNVAVILPNLGVPPSQSQISSVVTKTVLLFLPVFSVVELIWIVFNVRSFNVLSDKSKVSQFKTGAKVLLAGALVTLTFAIIFAVVGSYVSLAYNSELLVYGVPGGFVQDAAWVLLATAYFGIQASSAPPSVPINVQTAPTVYGQVRYCTKCGAPNWSDAVFCSHCGQKLA
jgi:uncharacterized membrane protein/ribosomal protein L40E